MPCWSLLWLTGFRPGQSYWVLFSLNSLHNSFGYCESLPSDRKLPGPMFKVSARTISISSSFFFATANQLSSEPRWENRFNWGWRHVGGSQLFCVGRDRTHDSRWPLNVTSNHMGLHRSTSESMKERRGASAKVQNTVHWEGTSFTGRQSCQF